LALHNNSKISNQHFWVFFYTGPDRLKNKRTYRGDLRSENDCITTGDTIVLARDERYGLKEQQYYEQKAVRVMRDTLQKVQTDIYNPVMPFSDRAM